MKLKNSDSGAVSGFDRRRAMALMGTGLAAGSLPGAAWAEACRPVLATPEQLVAERALLKLMDNPQIKALQASLKTELLKSNIGSRPDGAATLGGAIDQWTRALLFKELSKHRKHPTFLWGTDDTPRAWYGHELGGVGDSGDNPDNIYRTAAVDGGKAWEVIGQIDQTNPAAQLVIQVDAIDVTDMSSAFDMSAKQPSIVSATIAILTDRDLTIDPTGHFRITLGGEGDGPNHVALRPGIISVGTRDMLSDWFQKPAALEIRERGVARPDASAAPEQPDLELLLRNTLADLPGYVRFWANFPNVWFGGLKPNSISQARPREKGWGYVAGLRFDLAEDEAVLVRTGSEGAAYTGFQICDPWMIAADARAYQVCLNLSQATASPDGFYTYVISRSDPGIANWLDTAGVLEGMSVIRWQDVPQGANKDRLLQEFRVIKLTELDAMPDLPRVTPAQRREVLAERAIAYSSRTRVAM